MPLPLGSHLKTRHAFFAPALPEMLKENCEDTVTKLLPIRKSPPVVRDSRSVGSELRKEIGKDFSTNISHSYIFFISQ